MGTNYPDDHSLVFSLLCRFAHISGEQVQTLSNDPRFRSITDAERLRMRHWPKLHDSDHAQYVAERNELTGVLEREYAHAAPDLKDKAASYAAYVVSREYFFLLAQETVGPSTRRIRATRSEIAHA